MFSIYVCIKNNYDYSHKLDIKIGTMSERGRLTQKKPYMKHWLFNGQNVYRKFDGSSIKFMFSEKATEISSYFPLSSDIT